MNTMSSVIVAMALLATGAAAASSSGCGDTMDMVDNWRVVQPVGTTRTVYRTSFSTGSCNTASSPSTTSPGPAMTTTKYKSDSTDASHWTYADQDNWNLYGKNNECGAANAAGTYPGESPINIDPTTATATTTNPTITLEGTEKTRTGMPIFNNGHTIGYSLCPNKLDCDLQANFGTWPKSLRGITDTHPGDDYFALQMHFHWGSDATKGSEHTVCGIARAAELHVVWVNQRNITSTRTDPESGLLLAVTGIMIEGGATEDNAAFASLIDSVASKAPNPGNAGGGVSVNLKALLPYEWGSKFYTYPGSLTTPPCSQVVSWFVFENMVQISDAQLAKLRATQMPAVH